MLGALTLLLIYQLAGEVIVQFFALPVPGPVIGMALLFATLLVRGGVPENLRSTASNLLQHLSLLFVPAGVGVMVHFSRLGDEWPAIVGALLVSTFVTLAVTGLLLCAFVKRGKSQS
ncbi:MAG TPA: CidA/LrgA family protein [Rhodocyclaceae bacterium]|nr:CidA/LrgA family protein [Rhodocyclaceae bacterium]